MWVSRSHAGPLPSLFSAKKPVLERTYLRTIGISAQSPPPSTSLLRTVAGPSRCKSPGFCRMGGKGLSSYTTKEGLPNDKEPSFVPKVQTNNSKVHLICLSTRF